MPGLLVLLSLIAVFIGFFFLSEATMGVGIIGIAGVLMVLARIAQSDRQQKAILAKLDASNQKGSE